MTDHNDRPSFPRWLFLHVIPAGLLFMLGAALIIGLVVFLRHDPAPREVQRVLPAVEATAVQPKTVRIEIQSQGTVEARTRTILVAEVSGRVESISPALYAGGFFKEGDVLAKIESIDYEAALAAAKSRYAEAQLAYQQELASAEQAQEDWSSVGNQTPASELVLRKPQLARAQANLEASEAAVEAARRDLERTRIKAPYDGRVQEKFVDVGQIVNARASQIASIYSIGTAEIRLAIPLSDTRFIDLPEAYRDASTAGPKPPVTISSVYGGRTYQWDGVIDRSEGAVDPQTRLLYVVAQVEDPYGKDPDSSKPPLKVGSFVTAIIHGKTVPNAYEIERRALREDDTVYVIDEERRLDIRPVEVLQKTTEIAIITDGLQAGELVCTTPLQYVVDGMEVVVEGDEPPDAVATAGNEPDSASERL